MNKIEISKKLARRIVLNAQLLDGRPNLSYGKEGIAQIIEKLGYIQIDTISVIKRAHHHTIWTRCNDYQETKLHELQAIDRRIFEYWGHAMSYLPMSDYRFYLPRMRNFENPSSPWAKYQMEKCGNILEPVLDRMKKEGPLSSKDFANIGKKGGTWWDWKPAKAALELLFWQGKLMITERHNFQKVYDLTERVLPENLNTTMPTQDELAHFFVRRALSAMGLASEREIQKFLQPDSARDSDIRAVNKETILKSLNESIEAKEIIPVQIEENQNTKYYALSETIEQSSLLKRSSQKIFLLSPFDNLIIQRDRTKRLFDFDYTLECYVPAPKRKYGYFVLPILWGNTFVGRLDAKADRPKKTFVIRNLTFEPEFKSYEKFFPLFAKKIAALSVFNECEKITVENVSPGYIKRNLNIHLKNIPN
ncbi:YcaQ family DNA glycosylase [candidate division KSB1 bacterium]|nr:YcaQ family DNA glycosylase [candidate division KSB1 bacterium]